MMDATILLGIGNRLWADEGFGPAVVDRLAADPRMPAGVAALDGGTLGLYLLPCVQQARRLLVFDAVDFGNAPGTLVVLRDSEIPAFFGQRPLSLHQTGFTDVLPCAQLTGAAPEAITLIGVQPERIDDWGGDLTQTVAAAIPRAIDIGLAELAAWQAEGRQQ
jgi:hydrogenase maturation protease